MDLLRRHTRRLLGLLLAGALLLGGCVYLRLLDLKKQFARFDTYFRADTTDGVRIDCLQPLLLPGDVRWLGVYPEKTFTDGDTETWAVRWIKEAPPGEPETATYDVELTARFTEERLVYVGIPERYFAFFPKNLFVNFLRSTGQARINRSERSAEVESAPEANEDLAPPNRTAIDGMLGRPNQWSQKGETDIYLYRYLPQTPEKKAKPIEVTFSFSRGDGTMQSLTAQLPTGTVHFRVKAPAAQARR